jgi:hypothetical protein
MWSQTSSLLPNGRFELVSAAATELRRRHLVTEEVQNGESDRAETQKTSAQSTRAERGKKTEDSCRERRAERVGRNLWPHPSRQRARPKIEGVALRLTSFAQSNRRKDGFPVACITLPGRAVRSCSAQIYSLSRRRHSVNV